MFRHVIAIFVLFIVTFVFTQGQTLDEILKKHYDARGGLKNIRSVQTIQYLGTMKIMGKDYPLIVYQKRTGGYRSDMTMGKTKIVQAFDGKSGWQIIPMTGSMDPVDMTADELRSINEDADLDGYLIDSQNKGYRLELIGTEQLNGSAVFHIKVIRKDSTSHHIYIDSKTYLPVKHSETITMRGEETEIITTVGDYKKVGKIVLPFSTEIGGGMPQKILYNKIIIDKPIDDSLFIKPGLKK